MFFIARCLFWLTLVFVNLPDGKAPSVSPGDFLDMARSHVEAFSRKDGSVQPVSVAVAVDQGADWCRAHGEACIDAVLAQMHAKAGGAIPETKSVSAPGAVEKALGWLMAAKSRG